MGGGGRRLTAQVNKSRGPRGKGGGKGSGRKARRAESEKAGKATDGTGATLAHPKQSERRPPGTWGPPPSSRSGGL